MSKQNLLDKAYEKIICAIDTNNFEEALDLISKLNDNVIIKLGLESFCAFGIEGLIKIKNLDKNRKIFLDLKFNDIPNTVYGAVYSTIMNIEPYMITVHASGGESMLKAAVDAAKKAAFEKNKIKPLILAVTLLTSLDKVDLNKFGWTKSTDTQVGNFAEIAINAGCDGIVCSALELSYLKYNLSQDIIKVTPGIRLKYNQINDQKRIMTPEDALKNGASYIVVGRPIIESKNPNEVIKMIAKSMII